MYKLKHTVKTIIVTFTLIAFMSTFGILTSCSSLPAPVIPPIELDETYDEPLEAYDDYKLSIEKKFLGYDLLQGEEPVRSSYKQLDPLFLDSSWQVYSLYKKARRRNTTGIVVSSIGGALVGTILGVIAIEGKYTPGMVYPLAAGAGVATTGLIISATQRKPLIEAVDEYNEELTMRRNKIESDKSKKVSYGVLVARARNDGEDDAKMAPPPPGWGAGAFGLSVLLSPLLGGGIVIISAYNSEGNINVPATRIAEIEEEFGQDNKAMSVYEDEYIYSYGRIKKQKQGSRALLGTGLGMAVNALLIYLLLF